MKKSAEKNWAVSWRSSQKKNRAIFDSEFGAIYLDFESMKIYKHQYQRKFEKKTSTF